MELILEACAMTGETWTLQLTTADCGEDVYRQFSEILNDHGSHRRPVISIGSEILHANTRLSDLQVSSGDVALVTFEAITAEQQRDVAVRMRLEDGIVCTRDWQVWHSITDLVIYFDVSDRSSYRGLACCMYWLDLCDGHPLPLGLKRLRFHYIEDDPLNWIYFPSALETLEFCDHNQRLNNVWFPDGLKHLNLGNRFNQPIDFVWWPCSLKTLRFGEDFNQPVLWNWFPESLEELYFGYDFNHSLKPNCLPAKLRVLHLGGRFNHTLREFDLPAELQHLCLSERYNTPLIGRVLPDALVYLRLGDLFDQHIDDVVWPDSLREIDFGNSFNHSIDHINWPSKLQRLRFGRAFNQPLSSTTLPCGLHELVLGASFDHRLDNVEWPPSLRFLTLAGQIDRTIGTIGLPCDCLVRMALLSDEPSPFWWKPCNS